MVKYNLIEHPLVTHKLTEMRDAFTDSKTFRRNLNEISTFMAYQVMSDLPMKSIMISTPITSSAQKVVDRKVMIVPILRAGLGMVDGFLNAYPDIQVGHVGMERNESTLEPRSYYYKVPSTNNSLVIVIDPMLATGGSANLTISELKRKGLKNIRLACLLGVEEGIKKINDNHPDVDVYLCAVDKKLNEKGYIVPGLGDAGNRVFNTE